MQIGIVAEKRRSRPWSVKPPQAVEEPAPGDVCGHRVVRPDGGHCVGGQCTAKPFTPQVFQILFRQQQFQVMGA